MRQAHHFNGIVVDAVFHKTIGNAFDFHFTVDRLEFSGIGVIGKLQWLLDQQEFIFVVTVFIQGIFQHGIRATKQVVAYQPVTEQVEGKNEKEEDGCGFSHLNCLQSSLFHGFANGVRIIFMQLPSSHRKGDFLRSNTFQCQLPPG